MASRRRKRLDGGERLGQLPARDELTARPAQAKRASPASRALDLETRRKFEALLGADLDDVRLHEGPEAHAEVTRRGGAAFARGRDIYFSQGAYAPEKPAGERLLAHELVHVVQGQAGGAEGASSRDALEGEAAAIAQRVSGGTELLAAPRPPIQERAGGAMELFAEEAEEELVPKVALYPHQITPGHGQGQIQVGAASVGFRYVMANGSEQVELLLDVPKDVQAQVAAVGEGGALEIDDQGGTGARRIAIMGQAGSGKTARVRAQLTSGADTLVAIFQFPA
jgi:hypothetical protein